MKKDENNKKANRIIAPHGLQTEIANILSVERKTVGRALKGSYNITKKAAKIRQLALENGGIEVIGQYGFVHKQSNRK